MSSMLIARRRDLQASSTCASSKTSNTSVRPLTEAPPDPGALDDAAPYSHPLHLPAGAAAASICCVNARARLADCCSCSHGKEAVTTC